MRKHWSRTALRVAGAGLLGLLALVLVRRSEPAYQGRSVSGWINALAVHEGQNDLVGNSSRRRYVPSKRAALTKGMAMDALRAIGPPAVPYLVRALRKQDGQLRKHYLKFYTGAGPRLARLLPEPVVDAVYVR